jgi:hypothetical protein
MDVGLIHGDGVEAARALQTICRGTPIIYITGSPEAVRNEPGAVVLEKPITAYDLALALKEVGGPSLREPAHRASASTAI